MEDIKMTMLCDPEIWQDVLDRTRKKKGTSTDIETLGAVTDTRGRALLIQAIADGRYTISPPKTLYVDKTTGVYLSYNDAKNREFENIRTLYAPSQPLDGIVLAVLSTIYNKLYGSMIHNACKSYQRGVGVKQIIHNDIIPRLTKKEIGYKLDISKYFDSVNKDTLDSVLKSISSESPVDALVWNHFHDDRVYVNSELTDKYLAIRQGNALGTLLANLALKDIDEVVTKLDVLYVRYADDILVLGKDADVALSVIKAMLTKKGLALNDKKTQRLDSEKPFTFLGCEICGTKVDMSKDSYDKIKRKIRLICRPHKYIPKESRDEQVKAIKRINWLLRDGNYAKPSVFGWEKYFYSIVNTTNRIKELDHYIRDHIKGVYVGRQTQHRKAKELTSDSMLYSMGYKNLLKMYYAHKCGKTVYDTQLMEVTI